MDEGRLVEEGKNAELTVRRHSGSWRFSVMHGVKTAFIDCLAVGRYV